ncbi:MAG: beta-ketoacyl synthase N-terminal-like domain-containing protein [Desulfobacteraceae bacterium]
MKTDKSAAIIGMGCIFPKAAGLKQYWNLLFSGTDAITGIPEETHFSLKDFHDQDPSTPDHIYCKRGGFIPAVTFDPSRYGIPPKNLEATDTSQLLGLMVAEMALKDAGYPADQDLFIKKRTNVILGVTGTQELVIPLGARLSHPAWKRALDDSGIGADKKAEILKRLECSYNQWQENSFPGLLGNVVAGRIANRLDLGGTNTVVDAACASSLSAVNTALMELASGKCDMSITGGVDTLNDIFMHMCFSKTGVLSATSDARPFSADADGTVLGEGIGMVVLKRLEDAVRDNDRIYAVIRGVGTSSDGSTGGIYAPDAAGQKRALEAAYREASVDPSTVGFIEAHGTGTRVGDKIEFTALNDFMKQEQNSCAVGSVKSMIGHTKAAAGVAGMIKAALSLHHKTIFPTLKAENPDPELDIQNSSFYLNNQAIPWIHPEENRHPRRAAVSAFGFGGSNFHAVLEEHQRSKTKVAWDGSVQIAAFSDDDTTGLKNAITGFIKEFRDADNLDQQEKQDHLARITARLRKTFDPGRKHRLAMVVNTSMDPVTTADASLDIVNSGKPSCEGNADIFYGSGESPGCLGFLFPGQGSQYTGMGRDIASVFPEAMEAFSLFESAFARLYAGDGTERLSRYIFPLPAYQVKKKTAEALLTATDIAQPAIGALSLAMIRVLERFGIKPDFTCGHSFGELSALAAAGVIDDRTFAELSCIRGGLMAEAASLSPEKGGMLAVKAPLEDIEAFVASEAPGLVLANRNSPEQGVLSGSLDEIEKAYTRLKKKKIRAVKLPVAAAFHSELVAASAAPFAKALEKYPFSSGSIPVYSNTTGEIYPGDPAEAKKLLGRQLQNPVNFIMNIRGMMENRVSTFVEAGPGKVLSGLAGAIVPDGSAAAVPVDAVSSRKNGIQSLASVLARLSAMGYGVDLTQWEEKGDRPEQKRMRVLLTGANPKPENRCDIPPSSPDTLAVEKDAEPDVPDVKPVNNTGTPKGKSTDMHRQNSRFHEKQDQKTVSSSSGNASMDFEAMKMLKEGLDSIRQLQSETAKAHEKFLETQAETGRVLQSMMTQTRAYADHVTGEAPLRPESMPATENSREHGPGNVEQPPDQKPEHGETAIADTAYDTGDAADTVRAQKTVNNDNKAAKSVWQTVSRLTGFPEEMLEGDMDIESDLGIDSIKKVEIVSELEKHFPEASGLTTETLGTVRTLDDICAAISGGSVQEPVPEQKDSGPAPNPSEQDNTTDSGFILDTLFKTVSNLTGFPQEMLEGDMDLESDLGIDSIKRVEILSALEKDLPRAGSISTDDAAGLKTIRDIAGFLDNQPGQGTESQPSDGAAPIADTGEQDQKEQKTGNGKTTAKKKLARQRVSLKTHPVDQVKFYNGSRFSLAPDRKVYISRDSSGLCLRFLDEFAKKGVAAEIIDITGDTVPDLPDAGGIVVLADPAESGAASSDTILKSAFLLANRNGEHLISAAEKKAAFFATVSFLGGAFGFDGTEFEDPLQGGLAGLAKTADLEWKSVECKAVDLPASIQEARENVETAVSLINADELGLLL